jgi:hypothetical protein
VGPLVKDQVRSREKLLLTEKGESRGTCDETAVGVGADGVGEEVVEERGGRLNLWKKL